MNEHKQPNIKFINEYFTYFGQYYDKAYTAIIIIHNYYTGSSNTLEKKSLQLVFSVELEN